MVLPYVSAKTTNVIKAKSAIRESGRIADTEKKVAG
jgi:hypothetical protein